MGRGLPGRGLTGDGAGPIGESPAQPHSSPAPP